MVNKKYDTVVIGAGLGGLSAAAYLAKTGKRVLVLEQLPTLGGYAGEFKRGAYRFEASLHTVDGVAPGGWSYHTLKDLGLLDRMSFQRLDPCYTACYPQHHFNIPADALIFEAELVRFFPQQARGIRELMDAMMSVYAEVRRFINDGELFTRPGKEAYATQYPHLIAAERMNWAVFMAQYIDDERLKAMLSAGWIHLGLPPSRLNAVNFIVYWISSHYFGTWYPEGGSAALSNALKQAVINHGGEILTQQRVRQIEIYEMHTSYARKGLLEFIIHTAADVIFSRGTPKKQRTCGIAVETEQGLQVETSSIISNIDPIVTLFKLVGQEKLPEQYVDRLTSLTPSLSGLVVYLGLKRNLYSQGWQPYESICSDGYDTEADFDAALNGDFSKTSYTITNYSRLDPAYNAEGGTTLALFTLAPWDYANQWGTGGDLEAYGQNASYLELKREAAHTLIRRAEKHIPGLRQSIKYIDIATPLTFWRYLQHTQGAIYGAQEAMQGLFNSGLGESTPIENLFLTGAWVNGGGVGTTLLSGRNTARRAIAYLDHDEILPVLELGLSQTSDAADRHAGDRMSEISIDTSVGSAEIDETHRKAPSLSFITFGTRVKVRLDALGKPAILLFYRDDNQASAESVAKAVYKKYYPDAPLLVINVIALRGIPRLMQKLVESEMKRAYEKAVASYLDDPVQAKERIFVLADWSNSAVDAFGMKNVDRVLGVAVLDADGVVVGTYQGDDVERVAFKMLSKIGL